MGTVPGSGDAAASPGDPASWSTAASSLSWSSPSGSPALPTRHERSGASQRGSRVFLSPVEGEGMGQERLTGQG